MADDGSFLVPFLRLTKSGEPQEDRETVCEWTGITRVHLQEVIHQEPDIITPVERLYSTPRVTEVQIEVDLLMGEYSGPDTLSAFNDYGLEFWRPQAPIDPLCAEYEAAPGAVFFRFRYGRVFFSSLNTWQEGSFTLTAKPGSKGIIYAYDLVKQEI